METVHIKTWASTGVNWKNCVKTGKVSTHQRVLQGFHGTFFNLSFIFFLAYFFDVANPNFNYCRSCRNQFCLLQCKNAAKRCFRKVVIVRPI